MKTIPLFLLVLLLGMPASGRAERAFRLWGALGADYQQRALTFGKTGSTNETVWAGINADLKFSSALISRHLLEYSLWLNAGQGIHSQQGIDADTDRLGYGLELTLFPRGANRLQLSWGKNAYDYANGANPDYSERGDFWTIAGILWGWQAKFSHHAFQREGITHDDRVREEGRLKKVWQLADTQLTLDVIHFLDDYKFFRYSNQTDSSGLYLTHDLGSGGRVTANALFQRFAFEDYDVALKGASEYGNLHALWTQQWNWRWETLAGLDGASSDDSDFVNASFTNRYRLLGPLRMDLRLGYLSKSQYERSASVPYGGLGLYYFQESGRWRYMADFGVDKHGQDDLLGGSEDGLYYFNGGINYQGKAQSASLDVNYRDFSIQYHDEWGEVGEPGEAIQVTSQNTMLKLELGQRLGLGASLNYMGTWNGFRLETSSLPQEVTTVGNQLDLHWGNGSLGVRHQDYDQQGGQEDYRVESFDLHGRYALNSHLSFEARFIQRDRLYQFREEQEEESSASMLYIVGKFHFSAIYQNLEAASSTETREDQSIRIVLKRWFGDG